MNLLIMLAATLAAASAGAAEISREDLKNALDKNPDIVLGLLREHKKEVFEIVNLAAQEDQARRQQEAAAAEKKEFDESFKRPKNPLIDTKAHARGSKTARYTLVEYSDFQCPYCTRGAQTVDALRKKYGTDLRVIFKNLPLAFHSQAMPAARYFEAVGLQSPDKAWEFHDKLFANQGALGEPFYQETAKALGIDLIKLHKDAQSPAVQEKINADMAEAQSFGFTGTPGYLLNGIPVRGAYPVERFDEIITRLNQEKKN